MSKTTFYSDPNILFEYEIEGPEAILHCDVYSWKLSVLKNAYVVFAKFIDVMKRKGISILVTVTPNPAFTKLFGGKTLGYLEHENKNYEVIVWELK